jgi:hypothetical protein
MHLYIQITRINSQIHIILSTGMFLRGGEGEREKALIAYAQKVVCVFRYTHICMYTYKMGSFI